MATVLAAGASCQVFSDLEQLMQVSDQWPVERRLRARAGGESGWLRHDAPLDCTPSGCRDAWLTTNGTRLQSEAAYSWQLLFVNRAAVVQYVSPSSQTVWIVGSGWRPFHSKIRRCDTAFETTNLPLQELAGNDSNCRDRSLLPVARQLIGLFHQASHGKRLLRLDCHEDLKYCSKRYFGCIQREPSVLKGKSVGSAHLIGIDGQCPPYC